MGSGEFMSETFRWSYFKGAKPKLGRIGETSAGIQRLPGQVHNSTRGLGRPDRSPEADTHRCEAFPGWYGGPRKEGKCTLPGISGAYYDSDKRGNEFALGSQLLIFDIDSKHKGMAVSDLNEILTKVEYKFAYYESSQRSGS